MNRYSDFSTFFEPEVLSTIDSIILARDSFAKIENLFPSEFKTVMAHVIEKYDDDKFDLSPWIYELIDVDFYLIDLLGMIYDFENLPEEFMILAYSAYSYIFATIYCHSHAGSDFNTAFNMISACIEDIAPTQFMNRIKILTTDCLTGAKSEGELYVEAIGAFDDIRQKLSNNGIQLNR